MSHASTSSGAPLILVALLSAAALAGCRQDMHDQPKKKAQAASAFFADGKSARNFVAGTVARGRLEDDDHFYKGKVDGKFVETFPMEVTAAVLERGRNRFNIHCANCHGRVGLGDGPIVARGLKTPPSYMIERLLNSPPGYFFDVVTNGFGSMYDLADRLTPADRWAVVAYVRVLQQSQNVKVADLSAAEREKVKQGFLEGQVEHAAKENHEASGHAK